MFSSPYLPSLRKIIKSACIIYTCAVDFLKHQTLEHNSSQTEATIESLKAVTAVQDKKLSDYIVESFVRFNGLENKLEEVIDFVNVNVSNASKNSTASRKPTASRQNPKSKDLT